MGSGLKQSALLLASAEKKGEVWGSDLSGIKNMERPLYQPWLYSFRSVCGSDPHPQTRLCCTADCEAKVLGAILALDIIFN